MLRSGRALVLIGLLGLGLAQVALWLGSSNEELEAATWLGVMRYELAHVQPETVQSVGRLVVETSIRDHLKPAEWQEISDQLASRGGTLETADEPPDECYSKPPECSFGWVETDLNTPLVGKTANMFVLHDLNGYEVWMVYVLGRWIRLHHRHRWM